MKTYGLAAWKRWEKFPWLLRYIKRKLPETPIPRLRDDFIGSYFGFESKSHIFPECIHELAYSFIWIQRKKFLDILWQFSPKGFLVTEKPSGKVETIVYHILHEYQDEKIIFLMYNVQNTFFFSSFWKRFNFQFSLAL